MSDTPDRSAQMNFPRSATALMPGIMGDMPERLRFVVDTMRELSSQTDPQMMVRLYAKRMQQVFRGGQSVSLSRRDLEPPWYRITRSSIWKETVNPWTQRDRLPLFKGGLLAELIWGDEPRVIPELSVAPDDPAAEYFAGMRSAVAIPLYDEGVARNMVVLLSADPAAYPIDALPEHVWISNLFGRATHNLVLRDEVKRAYEQVDRELKVVADIQRSLLPDRLPEVPGLELASHYQTSKHAGGDYYDFFRLPGGQWGILIADVSGHGTPAAVIMAITHSIAHTIWQPPHPPSRLLTFINAHLAARYTNGNGTFVTAFYGVWDPANRRLTYSSAGHCPPRLRQVSGEVVELDNARQIPLGIDADAGFEDCTVELCPGESLVLYTDGITEARGEDNELFGIARLDQAVHECDQPSTGARSSPRDMLASVLRGLKAFTGSRPVSDDRTLLIARVK